MWSHYSEAIWSLHALPEGDWAIPSHLIKSLLFDQSCSHVSKFNITFLLNKNPHHWYLLVVGATEHFKVPDFHPALGNYFGDSNATYANCNGHRKSTTSTPLTFCHINISECSNSPLRMPKCYYHHKLSKHFPHPLICHSILIDVEDGSGSHTSASDMRCECSCHCSHD